MLAELVERNNILAKRFLLVMTLASIMAIVIANAARDPYRFISESRFPANGSTMNNPSGVKGA